MSELATVRFADLIDELIKCSRQVDANPERCWDIGNELLPMLEQAIRHCLKRELEPEAKQLWDFGQSLHELRHEIAMNILAAESPQEVDELIETFGPFPIPSGDTVADAERQSLREKALRGSIAEVAEFASKLRKSIRKTVADADASVAVPDSVTMLTVKQAAKMYNIGQRTVYRLVEKGLPHTKIGKTIRINPADLELWLSEGEQGEGEFD
jgi:excisionase family DNA binding protein